MLPPLPGSPGPNGQTELLKVIRTAAVQCSSVVGVHIGAQMKRLPEILEVDKFSPTSWFLFVDFKMPKDTLSAGFWLHKDSWTLVEWVQQGSHICAT